MQDYDHRSKGKKDPICNFTCGCYCTQICFFAFFFFKARGVKWKAKNEAEPRRGKSLNSGKKGNVSLVQQGW